MARNKARETALKITVNGLADAAASGSTVETLIVRFGERDPGLIVEVNGRFIYPRDYGRVKIRSGDRLEMIHPAFGG